MIHSLPSDKQLRAWERTIEFGAALGSVRPNTATPEEYSKAAHEVFTELNACLTEIGRLRAQPILIQCELAEALADGIKWAERLERQSDPVCVSSGKAYWPDVANALLARIREGRSAGEYTQPAYIRFVSDMDANGIPWEHYHGRFFWHGPAVRTTNDLSMQDVMLATRVKLQRDSMGLHEILYPVVSDSGESVR